MVRWVAASTLLINKHGTKYFKSIGNPVIRPSEPGENWKWCYVDEGLIAWQSSYFEYKIKRVASKNAN